jgi:outer membrane protein assembly factor BamD (BamD/ComL family)
MTHRTHTRLAAPGALALAAALLGPSLAHAQTTPNEFRLDASGNLVQTRPAAAPDSDQALIAQVRQDLAEERFSQAQAALDAFLSANERTANPLLAEAYLLRGDALTAQGDEYDALYDYERVIRDHPASPHFVTAIERELDIAVRYANGLKRKLLGVRLLDAGDIAEELLIRVQERMPGSRLAERAGIELADYYYRQRDLAMAVQAYDLFIENYPSSQYAQKAMQRRIYATIGRFKGPRYDSSSLIDAKILTRRYASLYPQAAQEAGLTDGLIARLDESAGADMLETARYYFAQDDEVSARYVLRRLTRMHPRTQAAAEALRILEERGWGLKPAEPIVERAPQFEGGAKADDRPQQKDDAP